MRKWAVMGTIFAATTFFVAAQTAPKPFGSSSGNEFFQDPSNPNGTWSGSKADLNAIIAQAKANYGFENSKHLGRNATMPVPASLDEMKREVERLGNPNGWDTRWADGAHGDSAESDDWDITWAVKSIGNGVVKYINSRGDEVVYFEKTGRIRMDEKMGTKNFDPSGYTSGHQTMDMDTHKTKASGDNPYERNGDQYKYVGILYERDPKDPNKFYIVDGQTGKRMTRRQVEDFPTTLSDMWKEQGLICVANDAQDYEVVHASTVNTAPAVDSKPVQPMPTPSGVVNTAPATQSYTIDNRQMKQWASQQLEGAYQYASGIAAEAGVGAEYQSAVAPVMNQGRAAISSIPDQQTVTVPTQVQQQ